MPERPARVVAAVCVMLAGIMGEMHYRGLIGLVLFAASVVGVAALLYRAGQ
jgi:hypothetical protein